ncbi:hypothetical protein B0H21DRAFT_139446 [Amylocystis lapponica]|nr:hypothetical protein B0H21DRAFT_139446 [Amylocystis lapponica]
MNMLTDDIPWPELGNVSRGATRGNQGQKGVLGPPDSEGRCMLQLRVQPGVLAVRLNRQASDWYRILDEEVNRALKLTKSYWRKARRRQDYDARADQDHMELHEWLQQLKDKVMSHLELLMQKGEIQGPPYLMSDNLELTFLRKFIERQANGISHNPRLRRIDVQNRTHGADQQRQPLATSSAISPPRSVPGWDGADGEERERVPSSAGSSDTFRALMNDVEINRSLLGTARAALARAQRDTQDAFSRYTACLDAETLARQQVALAEERRDTLVSSLVDSFPGEHIEDTSMRRSPGAPDTSVSSVPRSESVASTEQSHDNAMTPTVALPNSDSRWKPTRSVQWSSTDALNLTGVPHRQNGSGLELPFSTAREQDVQLTSISSNFERKHGRSWDDLHAQSEFEDLSALPPRKRHQISSTGLHPTPRSHNPPVGRLTLSNSSTPGPSRLDQSVNTLLNGPDLGNITI